VPGAGAGEQGVGAVDLVAGGAEVLPDRAEVGAAGDAVLAPVRTKRTRLRAKTGACGRAARQMASRRAVT
jgi:hypothetical protein